MNSVWVVLLCGVPIDVLLTDEDMDAYAQERKDEGLIVSEAGWSRFRCYTDKRGDQYECWKIQTGGL